MKLHFLVLSLALVQLTVSQNNQNTDDGIWNNLTPATVDGSTTIQNALSWGVGQVVASAVQAGSIPDTSYDVSGIYYVSQQQQVPQTNYRFEVQVVGAGGQTWRVKCDVNVANGQNTLLRSRSGPESDTRWDQTLQFGAFTFKPTNVYVPATATPPVTTTPPATTTNDTTTTPPATTNTTSSLDSEVWAEVDPNEVDTNEEIQKALIHGVSSVIDLAIENNEFPDTDYDVTGIYSVKKQQQTPSTNYRFEVELMAGTGQPFRVKCDVNVDTTTGVMDTYRWLYGGVDAAVWDQEMTLGTYDFLPDEVYLMDEDYVDAEEDGVVDLGDGLSLLL